jgi:hypothetical protein
MMVPATVPAAMFAMFVPIAAAMVMFAPLGECGHCQCGNDR